MLVVPVLLPDRALRVGLAISSLSGVLTFYGVPGTHRRTSSTLFLSGPSLSSFSLSVDYIAVTLGFSDTSLSLVPEIV